MSDITIIGTGNMARGIGSRAIAAGKSILLLAHTDVAKADALAAELGGDVSTGVLGDAITGSVVVGAVPFNASSDILALYRSELEGKVYVDIANPVDATLDGLAVPNGTSAAEELQKATNAAVVKAFNTTFAGTLVSGQVAGQQLDVLIAGDDDAAVRAVSDIVAAGGLRPIVVGPLRRARQLEQLGLLHIQLSASEALPEFQGNTAFKVLTAA